MLANSYVNVHYMPISPKSTLPDIGQPDYLSLLIEILQAGHPSRHKFDDRIFIGILFVLIAGEKNLIVDVDVNDLVEEYQAQLASQTAPSDAGLTQRDHTATSKHRVKLRIERAEERVRMMIQYVSRLVPTIRTRDKAQVKGGVSYCCVN